MKRTLIWHIMSDMTSINQMTSGKLLFYSMYFKILLVILFLENINKIVLYCRKIMHGLSFKLYKLKNTHEINKYDINHNNEL